MGYCLLEIDMRQIKGLFYMILSALMLMAGIWTAYADGNENSERETIRVGFFKTDGLHMINDDGEKTGYGYDLLRYMSRYLNVDYQYIGYDKSWAEMLRMLDDGELDMVAFANKTEDRLEKYDFSRPIGIFGTALFVKEDNQSVVPEDYSTYDGLRIALIEENASNDELSVLSTSKHFRYQPVYYKSLNDGADALQKGNVDAIVKSSLSRGPHEKLVQLFAKDPYYIIVKKGNTRLLSEINYALDQLTQVEGDWKSRLYQRYYGNQASSLLPLTDKEKSLLQSYIESSRAIQVLCHPDCYPYSYVENGEMKGILPDYFRRLADSIDLPFTFVICDSREEWQSFRNQGNCDLILDGGFESEDEIEQKDWVTTKPYMMLRVAQVVRRDFDGDIQTVAVVKQGISDVEDYCSKNVRKVIYTTRESAMQAVADGRVDAAYVFYYVAQEYVNRDQSGLLTYSLMEEPSFPCRIVVTHRANHMLAGILMKAIYDMPTNLVEEIASTYTSYKMADMTFLMMARLHPTISILLVLLMLFFIILLAMAVIRLRRMKQSVEERAEEMASLAEQAEMASRAKSAFLSSMSHDIRTPMNAIIGFTKIALEKNPDPSVRKDLEKIEISSKHLLTLLNDVLDISRIESGKVKFQPKPVDLSAIHGGILEITRGLIANRHLALSESASLFPDTYVMADEVRLREVLVNLISNAIKYTKDGGRIGLMCDMKKLDDRHVEVTYKISDSGIGMSREFVSHIFEEFTQEDAGAARTEYKGTGLGMAITKNYVELMGGTIEVRSQKDVGSTFTVKLPMEISDAPLLCADKETSKPVDLTGIHILLAEDNDLNAEIATVQLESLGVYVVRAVNGREALQLFETRPKGTFDIILMDIMMPEMDGYEATRAIRALAREDAGTIPILAITANAFDEDVEKSIAAGMNGHLSKPMEIDVMAEMISKNLGRTGD